MEEVCGANQLMSESVTEISEIYNGDLTPPQLKLSGISDHLKLSIQRVRLLTD